MESHLEVLKEAREALLLKMENNYQRSDQAYLCDLNMFISIFEETKNVTDRKEADLICAKHGFNIKREIE